MGDFNRESKTFDELLTFTRASTGTYFDVSGVLQTAAVDEPRFDHDLVTGEALGLLIEEQRTNLALRSEEFDNADWTKTGGIVVNADQLTAPDSNLSADNLVSDGVSVAQVQQAISFSGGQSFSASFFVRKTTTNKFHYLITILSGNVNETFGVHVNSRNGEVLDAGTILSGSGKNADAVYTEDKGGYWRVFLVATSTDGANNSLSLRVQPNRGTSLGDFTLVADTGTFWGAQLEQGAFPTSYIKTEGSQVTRSADSCSRTLGAEWSPEEGTFFIDFSIIDVTKITPVLLVSDSLAGNGSTSRYLRLLIFSGDIFLASGSNSNTVPAATAGVVTGRNKFAITIFDEYVSVSVNGSSNVISVPLDDTGERILWVGRESTDRYLSDVVRRVTYAPRALTEAELIALTSGDS